MSSRSFYIFLLLIMLFSFGTGLIMVNHHVTTIVTDEGGDLSKALRLLDGELPPAGTIYHRSAIAFHNLAAVGVYSGLKFLAGDFRNTADIQEAYFSNRHEFVIATRILMIFWFSLAVGFVGLAGRVINLITGLFAAVLLSLNTFVVINMPYSMPDSLVVLPTAIVMWLATRIYRYGYKRDYFFWGIAFGAVMVSKLSASPIGFVLLIVHGVALHKTTQGHWRLWVRKFLGSWGLWLAGIGAIVGNIIFNPLILIQPTAFFNELALSNSNYGSAVPFDIYLMNLANATDRWLSLIAHFQIIALLCGIILLIIHWRKVVYWVFIIPCLTLGIFLINLMTSPFSQIYYWTPFGVTMALVGGMGLAYLWEQAKQGSWKRLAYPIILLVFVAEGIFLAQTVRLVLQTSTQDLALKYIEETIPIDTKILSGDEILYGIPLQRNEVSIRKASELRGNMLNQWTWYLNQPVNTRRTPSYELYGPELQSRFETIEELLQIVEEEQIEYYITIEWCSGFAYNADSESSLDFPPNTPEITENWELVAHFSPFETDNCVGSLAPRTGLSVPPDLQTQLRPGAIIHIYRITR
jgi:hypothetical protein